MLGERRLEAKTKNKQKLQVLIWVLCLKARISAKLCVLSDGWQMKLLRNLWLQRGSPWQSTSEQYEPLQCFHNHRAFPWLKAPASNFTFKNLLRLDGHWALTHEVDMKLSHQFKDQIDSWSQFYIYFIYLLWVNPCWAAKAFFVTVKSSRTFVSQL